MQAFQLSTSPAESGVQRRIGWVDYAKILAIYSVVIIHIHSYLTLNQILKVVTMPVFFFVSGLLFSAERNPDFKTFAVKRFRQLVVPYVWINVVAYAAWYLVLRHYGNDADSDAAPQVPLLGAVFGLPSQLVHDIPLWSLLTFFSAEMVYYFLHVKCRVANWLLLVAAAAVAVFVSANTDRWEWELPFALAPLGAAVVYYTLGQTVKGRADWLFRRNLLLLLVGAAVWVACALQNDTPRFFQGYLGNPLLYIIGSIGGICVLIQLSVYLDYWIGDRRWVRLISRSTLLICGFHLMALAGIKGVLLLGFGVQPDILITHPVAWLYGIVALALCVPVSVFISRYLPWLVSKRV